MDKEIDKLLQLKLPPKQDLGLRRKNVNPARPQRSKKFWTLARPLRTKARQLRNKQLSSPRIKDQGSRMITIVTQFLKQASE